MDDRLTQLEELLAHQQRLLDDLNEVVTQQRHETDALRLEHERLKRTVAKLLEHHEAAQDAPDEKPPHY